VRDSDHCAKSQKQLSGSLGKRDSRSGCSGAGAGKNRIPARNPER
jgi:hypothetical protein